MKTFIINLDRDNTKWEMMEKTWSHKHHLNIERISATDGKILLKTPKNNLTTLCKWFCTPKMAGCFDSHKKCWKNIIENKIPYALILEDDAMPTEDFDQIHNIIKDIPLNWDLFYIGYHNYNISIKSSQARKISENIYIPYIVTGAHGYLISYQGAVKLCKLFPKINFSNDVVVNMHKDINMYGSDPPLVTVYPNKNPKHSQVDVLWFMNDHFMNVCGCTLQFKHIFIGLIFAILFSFVCKSYIPVCTFGGCIGLLFVIFCIMPFVKN